MEVFFLCIKTAGTNAAAAQKKTAANVSDDGKRKYTVEVEVVRVKITLACTECKQRNYNMTKEKKNHPERMETKKYCRFCKKHTMHKETK